LASENKTNLANRIRQMKFMVNITYTQGDSKWLASATIVRLMMPFYL